MDSADVERAVLDRILQEDLVSLTCDLIAAGGENPGGTEAHRVAVLQAACEAAGLQVELQEVAPERSNLIAMLPGGEGPPLMFLGIPTSFPPERGGITRLLSRFSREGGSSDVGPLTCSAGWPPSC